MLKCYKSLGAEFNPLITPKMKSPFLKPAFSAAPPLKTLATHCDAGTLALGLNFARSTAREGSKTERGVTQN